MLSSVAMGFKGRSYAEVTREVLRAKRHAVLSGQDLSTLLLAMPVSKERNSLATRLALAKELRAMGHSERSISERTGISRQTLSKYRGEQTITAEA